MTLAALEFACKNGPLFENKGFENRITVHIIFLWLTLKPVDWVLVKNGCGNDMLLQPECKK